MSYIYSLCRCPIGARNYVHESDSLAAIQTERRIHTVCMFVYSSTVERQIVGTSREHAPPCSQNVRISSVMPGHDSTANGVRVRNGKHTSLIAISVCDARCPSAGSRRRSVQREVTPCAIGGCVGDRPAPALPAAATSLSHATGFREARIGMTVAQLCAAWSQPCIHIAIRRPRRPLPPPACSPREHPRSRAHSPSSRRPRGAKRS